VERRQRLLRDQVARARGVHLSWSGWDETWLEAIMARGNRRLGAVIYRAWRTGARFDAWSECFRPDAWRQAFSDERLDPDFYTHRQRQRDEVLPWEPIDCGVTRAFLWREYERALSGDLSPDCRADCYHCGVLTAWGATRKGLPDKAWGCP